MNLSELTLIVPYRFDTPQRKRNFYIVTSYFAGSGARILPVEQSGSKVEDDVHYDHRLFHFNPDSDAPFYKTRLINQALAHVETPLVGVLDTDVICDLNSVQVACKELLARHVDLVYPYDGRFLEVPDAHVESFMKQWTRGYRIDTPVMTMAQDSVGGLFLTLTEVFKNLGGMNERFVSWGSEDKEVLARYLGVGLNVARIDGPIYHLEHPRSINSGPGHAAHEENQRQYERIFKLKTRELWKDEIEDFPWRSRIA